MKQEEFFKRYTYSIRTDKIGGGAFGTVYLAYDNVVNREVAIKVSEVKTIGGKEFSLQDEFNALKNLPVHPNIANYEALYTFEMQNGIFDYAIMQYYKDGNLAKILKQNLSVEQKEQLAIGLLNGIRHLHQHNIVHRDLKPSNILVIKRKNKIIPVITDFGLSKQTAEDAKTRFTNSFAGGTLKYSSPEQLKGAVLKLNTDLWAFAVIIYEIFTGKALFKTKTSSNVSVEADKDLYDQILNSDLSIKIKEVPNKWQKVLENCLIRDVNKRIKSAEDITKLILNTDSINKKEKTISNKLPTEQDEEINEDKTRIDKTVLLEYKKERAGNDETVINDTIINKDKKLKTNNKFFAIISSIILITILIFIFYPYETKNWENVQKQNTISSYEQYLKDYPQGKYKNEAKEIITWLKTTQENSINKYNEFIKQYPRSIFINDANTKLAELITDSMSFYKANTEETYKEYINNFHNGKYVEKANEIIENKTGYFTDKRDGQKYKWVKIGEQIWMVENLNYIGNNGHQHHIINNNEWLNNNKKDGWCYYDNDIKNGKKYGILYQSEAAKYACPNGWHIPAGEEWVYLTNYLGGGELAEGKLKSTFEWGKASGFLCVERVSGTFSYLDDEHYYFWGYDFWGNDFWDKSNLDGFTIPQSSEFEGKILVIYSSIPFSNDGIVVRCIKNTEEYTIWKKAFKENTKEAMQEYIYKYPNGLYVKNANKVIEKKQEEEAYNKAKNKGTKKAYQEYIQNYPKGDYVKEAKKAINSLSKKAKKKTPKRNEYGYFTDPRDGKTYKTIKIGTQTWFAENLNYTENDGYIKHITDGKEWSYNGKYNGWCYYNNNPSNGAKYGALYQWEAAKYACPPGWHIPTMDEWRELADYLGGEKVAGGKMKATYGWKSPNTGATNSSGFSAIPTGYHNADTRFSNLYEAQWWNTLFFPSGHKEGYADNCWYNFIEYNSTELKEGSFLKTAGFSVRCIKD